MPDGSKLRVLHLGSPAGMFGAERWILALCRYLPGTHVESIIGVVQDGSHAGVPPLCQHAEKLGFRSLTVHAPGKLSLAAIGQLRRFIMQERIDILHTHGYKSDILGVFAKRGTQSALVSTPHGWSVDAGIKLRVYEGLDRLAFAGCDAVVPLSDDLHAGLAGLPWVRRRLHLIPNGVDLSEVEAATTIADPVARARQAGAKVYGYIGQLINRKRIDTLIAAFAMLPFQNKELFILGDGPERTELERLAQETGQADRIHFEGFRDDRLNYLRGFDVFVLPSSLEGIPRCVMESMAAGIPSVVTDIEGCRALVQGGRTGLLFPVGDVQALIEQLNWLKRHPERAESLAEAGRCHVNNVFSAKAMADRYLQLYRLLKFSQKTTIPSPSSRRSA
ncbi:MAG: glycosyltransferase family 4 protein [Burkholderiales bacterium]|nr:glycosyltransferase family 4 protein [Burkholderiales bacterium]